MWVDYTIDSIPGGKGFKVKGDWEGEGHDRDMFATSQFEIGVFKRMHAPIMFGEAFGLENDVGCDGL